MAEYLVSWHIEVDAETPLEAAQAALKIQRDPKSEATVFDIEDELSETIQIDLLDYQ